MDPREPADTPTEHDDLDPGEAGILTAQPARDVVAKQNASTIVVEWNSGGPAQYYKVLRREASSSVWVELGTVPHKDPPIARQGTQVVPPHTFTDTGATSGVEYVYGIRTSNVKNESAIVESNRVKLP